MIYKITWGVLSAANVGHIEGWNGFLEKIKYNNMNWAFMVSTYKRTYLHVSHSYGTLKLMEEGAIEWLIDKGELNDRMVDRKKR